MTPSMTQETTPPSLENDPSLIDLLIYLFSNWKIYFASGLIGILIAFGLVSLRGQYTAEAILINNQESGLNYVSWRALQKNLVSLAQELASDEKQVSKLQRMMANGEWWKTAVLPTFAITKAETKDFVSFSKEILDAESVRIMNFVIKVNANSQSEAEQDINYVLSFIKTGSIFFASNLMISNLESKITKSIPRVNLEINKIHQEMKIINDRRDYLYSLRKEFPNGSAAGQIVDVNDRVAKFLPITTQLVAVLTDINQLDERLLQLKQEKAHIEVANDFVEQAKIILKSGLQDQNLIANLLNLEEDFRKKISPDDLSKIIALDNIRNDLIGIKVAYTQGLQQLSRSSVLPPKYLKSMVTGLIAGIFLGLLCLMLSFFWKIAKSRSGMTS
jgi:hypothetical protein